MLAVFPFSACLASGVLPHAGIALSFRGEQDPTLWSKGDLSVSRALAAELIRVSVACLLDYLLQCL